MQIKICLTNCRMWCRCTLTVHKTKHKTHTEFAVSRAKLSFRHETCTDTIASSCTVPSQHQLTAILSVAAKEAVRQICNVFGQLLASLAKENNILRDKVGQLEVELSSRDKQMPTTKKTKGKKQDAERIQYELNSTLRLNFDLRQESLHMNCHCQILNLPLWTAPPLSP